MKATMYASLLLIVAACTGVISGINQEQTDFEYACEQIELMYPEYSCDGLAAPIVVESAVIDDLSWGMLNGVYYPGENYIFINPYGTDPAKTKIHETVHYIIHKLQILDDSDKCGHEEVARLIAKQDWDWRPAYGCQVTIGEPDDQPVLHTPT